VTSSVQDLEWAVHLRGRAGSAWHRDWRMLGSSVTERRVNQGVIERVHGVPQGRVLVSCVSFVIGLEIDPLDPIQSL
jgi:hypothetical protein